MLRQFEDGLSQLRRSRNSLVPQWIGEELLSFVSCLFTFIRCLFTSFITLQPSGSSPSGPSSSSPPSSSPGPYSPTTSRVSLKYSFHGLLCLCNTYICKYRVTIRDGQNLPLTKFWQFWQLVGRYCSYLLFRQDGVPLQF